MALYKWPHPTPLFGLFGTWQQSELCGWVDASIATNKETNVLSTLHTEVGTRGDSAPVCVNPPMCCLFILFSYPYLVVPLYYIYAPPIPR
jgi:hypothetical protein